MVNFYKFAMADASAITTRPWFLAFSLAPISPQARVLQAISCLVVLVLITVLLCLFPERKSAKSIMNDSGPFHRVIRQLAITRHILYDQTSKIVPLSVHPTRSMPSG